MIYLEHDLMDTDLTIVLGNGFDLHLGLESSMKHFLTSSVFKTNGQSYYYNGTNLLYYLFYLRYFATGQYDYGSFRRVDNNNPSWMDVEGFIKKIATEDKIMDHLLLAYQKAIAGYSPMSKYDHAVTNVFSSIIERRKPSKSGAKTVIHKLLLDDLLEFEKDFDEYLKGQLTINPDYDKNSKMFLKRIIETAVDKRVSVSRTFVINFNYTKLTGLPICLTNVHGILDNKIVIGYDSTDRNNDNDIFELSKDWQKISACYSSFDISIVDNRTIVFYGHSLGEQDYPYFYELFDLCKLLDKNTKTNLVFCYSLFGSKEQQKEFLNNYQINISKLLNSYERYSRGIDGRNTIVTKLNSRKRLKLLVISDDEKDK